MRRHRDDPAAARTVQVRGADEVPAAVRGADEVPAEA